MYIYNFCCLPLKKLSRTLSRWFHLGISDFLLKSQPELVKVYVSRNSVSRNSRGARRSGDRSHSRGFTLIEALVVMIIIGVLSAIVAPSWVSFVDNQRLNSSQTKIFSAIKAAQSDAKVRQTSDSQTTTNNKRSRITFTSTAATFSASSDATFRLDNVRTDSGLEQSLEKGITIASVTYTTANTAQLSPVIIEFDSRGFIFNPAQVPICINLSTTNTTGRKRTSWIKIQTLLGAVSTGKDTTCS